MKIAEDFSIVFKTLEEAKKENDYLFLEDAMQNMESLKDPIEKLSEIVMESEAANYSVFITT